MPITFTATKDVPEDADVLAVPVFEGGTLPDGSPVELDAGFLAAVDFQGKPGQTQALLADDGSTILAVGVGKPDDIDAEALRRAAAAAVKGAWRAQRLATTLLDAAPAILDRAIAAQAIVEGASLAAYRFVSYKSDPKFCALESVSVVTGGRGGANVQKAIDRGARIAAAVNVARDLVNEPPTSMRPVDLEAAARRVADDAGLDLEVWDEDRIAAERLGGLAGVAAGSDEPPRLLRLTYNPPGARGTVALVGKGITFDSGGLSIKSGEGMMTMKCDMAGAAVVIAAMSALPALGVKTRVIGYAACTENLPSGKATKPGDVLRIRNGKTVEVLNTDAEGRLVLADGLSLAVEDEPDAIIDLATLTGAVSVALGPDIAGLMGNDDALLDEVRAASDRAGEPTWQLPLPSRYRKYIDSEVADIKNIGQGNKGGTLTAGLFLQEFVGDRPWVHIDLAGPAFRDNEDSYLPKGGTGYGVRTILELLSTYRAPSAGRGRR
jgi:leucyl aminopeptidase